MFGERKDNEKSRGFGATTDRPQQGASVGFRKCCELNAVVGELQRIQSAQAVTTILPPPLARGIVEFETGFWIT
jgi:hypothetical protein